MMFGKAYAIASIVLMLTIVTTGLHWTNAQAPPPDGSDEKIAFGRACDPTVARTCGTWQVGGPVCSPVGGTCVSSIVEGDCVPAFFISFCMGAAYCDGFCDNNPTEACWGTQLYCK